MSAGTLDIPFTPGSSLVGRQQAWPFSKQLQSLILSTPNNGDN
jgi:hypothetical protein